MTLFEAQNKVWPTIIERAKTKVKAVNSRDQCMYRVDGDANNMAPENCCFAGILITPENYKGVENKNLCDDRVSDALLESQGIKLENTREFIYWMNQVQMIHDQYPTDKWDILLYDLVPKSEE